MTEIMLLVLASLQPQSPYDRAACQLDAQSEYMQCLSDALDVALECEQERAEGDCRPALRVSVKACGDEYRAAQEECEGGDR